MALRFCDSFDHYVIGDMAFKWSGQGIGGISSGGRFNNCWDATGGSNRYLYKFLDNQPTWFVGCAVKCLNQGVAGVLFQLLDGTWNSQVELRLNTNNTLAVTRNGNALTGGTTTTTVPTGTWNYIELKVTIGTSIAANTCQIRINGQVAATVATGQSTQATANAQASIISLDGYNGQGPSGCLYDDFYICDATGTVNNGLLGDVRVEALYPNAAGDLSQWTPNGSATNYGCVNQANEDGDTTYVSDANPGDHDSYKFTGMSTTPSNVFGVQLNLWARKDDAGTRQIAPSLRIGGASYDGTTSAIGNSYTDYLGVWDTNPATGTNWAVSDLAAGTFQAGPKMVS